MTDDAQLSMDEIGRVLVRVGFERECIRPLFSAVLLAVSRVGVVANRRCEVKGFTAQIAGHTEGRCGKAGDPGGPCGLAIGETGEPRRQEQCKPDNRQGELITDGVGRKH